MLVEDPVMLRLSTGVRRLSRLFPRHRAIAPWVGLGQATQIERANSVELLQHQRPTQDIQPSADGDADLARGSLERPAPDESI